MLFSQHFDGEGPRNLNHVFLRPFENGFSQLRDVIHRNLAYLEGHEPPLNTAGGLSGVDQSSAVEIFPINTSEPAASIKAHTFQQVLNFPFKRLGFQSPPPSIKRIPTEITAGPGFVSVCVVLALRKPRMVCPLFQPPKTRKR